MMIALWYQNPQAGEVEKPTFKNATRGVQKLDITLCSNQQTDRKL